MKIVKNSIRVGSAVLIENKKGEILLAKSRKKPVNGMWVLPGGGINFGERAKEAARREIREETGLEIEVGDFITMLELIRKNDHRVIFYHKARLKRGKLRPSDDVSELIWMKPSKIKSMKNVAYTVSEILKRAKYIQIQD